MTFSRGITISNIVLVLELFLERNSPHLRKCRHTTLYVLVKILWHKPKGRRSVSVLCTPLTIEGERGKVDALDTTPFPLCRIVPLTLFDDMLRARRISIFLA